MDPSLTLSNGQLAAGIFTVVFLLVLPAAATIAAQRWLKIGWRYAFYGAAVFLVFQLLTRVPLIGIFGPRVQVYVQHSAPLLWGWLGMLALTAGLFEEVGRYLGFRVFFRSEEKTWPKAVMFGIGHGGLESLFIGGSALLSTVQLWTLSHGGLAELAPDQRQQAVAQLAKLAAQPAWLQLAGSWERIWAMLVQIAMAVIVLQVFVHGRMVWLWLAVLAHALVDFASIGTVQLLAAQPVMAIVATELLVALFGLASVWLIFHLRQERQRTEMTATDSGGPLPGPQLRARSRAG